MKTLAILLLIAALASCTDKDVTKSPSQSDTTRSNVAGSIYDAPLTFVDQYGHTVQWSDLKGKVRVMAMIFTHCQYACPRITKDIQSVQALLPKNDPRIVYTLVSFDTQADSAQRLLAYYKERHLDSNWLLLHGSEEDTRTVSALLDVKYKRMEDGLFSHQNIIFVIDKNGQIALRREGFEGDAKEVAEMVKSKL
jgi:protein SCO1/2